MIRPVDNPSSPEVAKQASPTPADPATGTDFAALHAAAVASDKTAAASPTPATERIDAPEGETWAATKPGAHYAEIVDGPRKGQFINLTHGARRGETFAIEQRSGKSVHVYGAGAKEVVVASSVDTAQVTNAAKRARHPTDQPRKGERWSPVAGHSNYADILGGSRNGLFVNISGGVRDGMAFQIVKNGDKVFHEYGTGKDRQMIQVAPKHAKPADASTPKSDGTTAAGTGGTSPATG